MALINVNNANARRKRFYCLPIIVEIEISTARSHFNANMKSLALMNIESTRDKIKECFVYILLSRMSQIVCVFVLHLCRLNTR
jgi:hypothetical protein